MSGLITNIPAPPNAILSGNPFYYPPKLIVEASRGVTSDGMEAIFLKCTNPREYTRDVRGFEVYLYEHIEGPFHPFLWRPFWEESIIIPFKRLIMAISYFHRNRRYFFSVRLLDSANVLGPFSDPVSIDI